MRIPGPKWGAGRPPLETPLPLVLKYLWRASAPWGCAIRIGRTPRRCAAGASVPLGKAASACALATAAAPPPLRLGASPPCPHVLQRKTLAGHAPVLGASPPCPQGSPLGNVCRSCAHAHGTAPDKAFAANPSQISRKLLPRKRLGVPSLSSRELRPQAAPARPHGESQRWRSPLWPVFAYFLLARK